MWADHCAQIQTEKKHPETYHILILSFSACSIFLSIKELQIIHAATLAQTNGHNFTFCSKIQCFNL